MRMRARPRRPPIKPPILAPVIRSFWEALTLGRADIAGCGLDEAVATIGAVAADADREEDVKEAVTAEEEIEEDVDVGEFAVELDAIIELVERIKEDDDKVEGLTPVSSPLTSQTPFPPLQHAIASLPQQ
ncbi:hypothetical protein MMC28_004584 [Mycoblastus sanguinarius]|nr:hypothetical protein [Mycoblastus sanguinarius]